MTSNKKIIMILLLAVLFRLFIIFCLPVRTFDNTIKRYHNAAVNLISGKGYSIFSSPPYQPSILKPPTYPLFLAGIYSLFGIRPNAVKIIQILIDVLGCFLLFLIAQKYFGQKAALTVMFFATICPITAVYANLLNPESLTLFLMILSLWFISSAITTNKKIYFLCAGISAILMGYCRPEFFVFIFIFGPIIFFMTRKNKIKHFLLYSLGAILIMAPWVLRNYNLTHKFIPLTKGDATGAALYLGSLGKELDSQEDFNRFLDTNPRFKQLWLDRYKYGPLNQNLNFDNASKYEDIFLRLTIQRIMNNPRKYIFSRIRAIPLVWINLHADEYTFLNTQKLRLLHPNFNDIIYYIKNDQKEILFLFIKYVFLFVNISYLLLALRGLWGVRHRARELSFIIIPLIYAQIFFLFVYRSAAYTIPYWPCIIFFSGVGFYYTFLNKEAVYKEKL